MKKILTILTLLSAFLLTACGPSYDYDSPEKLISSLKDQAKKEKLSDETALNILSAYAITVVLEDAEFVLDDAISDILGADSIKDLLEDVSDLESLKSVLEGKTFADMKSSASPIILKLVRDPDEFSRNLSRAMRKGLR